MRAFNCFGPICSVSQIAWKSRRARRNDSPTEVSMNHIGNDAARDVVRRAQGAGGAGGAASARQGRAGAAQAGASRGGDAERIDRRVRAGEQAVDAGQGGEVGCPEQGEAAQNNYADRMGQMNRARGEEEHSGLQRTLEQQLAALRFTTDAPQSRGAALEALCARGFDHLPLPGQGRTIERWSALAAVAACDLSLVKLYEGHTDALAILAELRASGLTAPGQRWGVWAAEPPNRKVTAAPQPDHARGSTRNGSLNNDDAPDNAGPDARDIALDNAGTGTALRLEGVKPWCSGAALLTHALVTAWRDGEPVLAAVELAQPSVHVADGGWNAIGMAATGTSEVCFDGALAWQVGAAGAYLARPGFWHGGGGIAACWYGCAAGIAAVLRAHVARRKDPHACAHLGAADTQLAAAGALLRETAAWIDRYPRADAMRRAMRARLAVEEAATAVLAHATRALGPGPLCTDLHFARAAADLPVFLRQSHAERDAAALGEALCNGPDPLGSLDPLDPLACEESDTRWRLACL
jgi:hypothetical protein